MAQKLENSSQGHFLPTLVWCVRSLRTFLSTNVVVVPHWLLPLDQGGCHEACEEKLLKAQARPPISITDPVNYQLTQIYERPEAMYHFVNLVPKRFVFFVTLTTGVKLPQWLMCRERGWFFRSEKTVFKCVNMLSIFVLSFRFCV